VKNALTVLGVLLVAATTLTGQQPRSQEGQQGSDKPRSQEDQQGSGNFRFKSGVELINVTATVADANGRFVPNLRQEDFTVYEDEVQQTVTQFSAERVPVSLGILLDTSGSMAGEKIEAARNALNRFVFDLLDDQDEVFLYRFSNDVVLLQDWTTDRRSLTRALGRINPNGGTAMYDALVEAVPMAAAGRNQKKAVVIISDGNDTASRAGVHEVRQLIRNSEVLVYAIGIDGEGPPAYRTRPNPYPPGGGGGRMPPIPFPFPGGRRPGFLLPQFGGPRSGQGGWGRADDRVNEAALRDITDDSGGRTEIIHSPRDLEPATAGIADELSKQYYLGYQSTGKKDGRWHNIRVEVKNRSYRVRSRKGYIAN
jgi:Ca-activated chloride channel family protein